MDGPVIDTRSGKVRGTIEKSILGDEFYAFKGIPYAKPPVGELRFQDPVPAEPWKGIRDAKNFGSLCAQFSIITNATTGTDDCLYLNVYAKSIQPRSKKPVMFWIHGGAFLYGDGNNYFYGPDYFMRKDIIFVTINYRLGILGFLNLEDEIAPGNQGLKDQVMALHWVHENIANFGGDPENVTIFGESAGASSVHYLCLSPLAKDLFHKAICQSGVVLNPWTYPVSNPKKFAYRLCSLIGNETQNHKEIVNFLRTIDVEKLIEFQEKVLTDEEKLQFILPFGPGIDSKSKKPFMPIHPTIAAENGIQIPLLIGNTNREGQLFLKSLDNHYEELNTEFEKHLHPNIKNLIQNYNLLPEALKRMYCYNEITADKFDEIIDLLGDMHFVEGIHRVIKIQVKKSCSPTYYYQYTYDKVQSLIQLLYTKKAAKGACHGDELQLMFRSTLAESLSIPLLKEGTVEFKIMEQMIDLWVNFATTGRPTPYVTKLIPFYWPPVNNEEVFRYLHIGEDLRLDAVLNLEQRFSFHKIMKNKL